ncbi:MAG: hypothetical protein NC213_05895 [Acetobacter sp.]|nr:hypothetical protein [Bacteroides sp.]MCM1341260.1 hypothetical protein [Acetobacter sp.]MCM1433963.1 hypothetical protein [Clostridiales bacterium]
MLYDELLKFSQERLLEFFKNTKIFENQFVFNDFSKICYEKMYVNNSYSDLLSIKSFKEEYPELRDLCKKCAAFYIPARNKSIPKYDVILGKQHEEILMDFLSKKLSAKIVRGDLQNRKYPDCKLLNNSENALAYFEVKFHGAPFIYALNKIGRYCYEGSATLDYKKIEKQIEIIHDEIDCPVFYLHWIEYPCLKGVFFETVDQVEKYIATQHEEFNRAEREGDLQKTEKSRYTKKMYSPLLEMGSFEEFIEVIERLM